MNVAVFILSLALVGLANSATPIVNGTLRLYNGNGTVNVIEINMTDYMIDHGYDPSYDYNLNFVSLSNMMHSTPYKDIINAAPKSSQDALLTYFCAANAGNITNYFSNSTTTCKVANVTYTGSDQIVTEYLLDGTQPMLYKRNRWYRSGSHVAKYLALNALSHVVAGLGGATVELGRSAFCNTDNWGHQACLSWSGGAQLIKMSTARWVIDDGMNYFGGNQDLSDHAFKEFLQFGKWVSACLSDRPSGCH